MDKVASFSLRGVGVASLPSEAFLLSGSCCGVTAALPGVEEAVGASVEILVGNDFFLLDFFCRKNCNHNNYNHVELLSTISINYVCSCASTSMLLLCLPSYPGPSELRRKGRAWYTLYSCAKRPHKQSVGFEYHSMFIRLPSILLNLCGRP